MKKLIRLKKFFKFNKTFYKLFMILMAFFVIPVVIASSFLYKYTQNIVESEVNDANFSLLKNTAEKFDTELKDIRRNILKMPSNPNITKLEYPLYDDADLIYAYAGVITELATIKGANDIINSVFIYYQLGDLFITDKGKIDINSYFSKYKVYNNINTKSWKKILNTKHMFKFINTTKVKTYNLKMELASTSDLLTILTTIPFNDVPKAAIGIQVDSASIKNILNSAGLTKNGSIYIIDDEGDLIAHSSANSIISKPSAELKKLFTGKESGYLIIKDDKKIMASFVTSKLTGWKYVALIPYEEISCKSDVIRTAASIICAALLFIGFIISYLSSRKIYSPIKDLIESIDAKTLNTGKINALKTGDEFKLIRNELENTYSKNKELSEFINIGIEGLQEKFYHDLLNDRFESQQLVEDNAVKLGISHGYKYLSVVIIKLEFFKESYNQIQQEDFVKIRGGVYNLIKIVLSQYSLEAYVFQKEKNEFVIITDSESDSITDLRMPFEDLINMINSEQDPVNVITALSSFTEKLFELPLLYKQVRETSNYKSISRKSQIIEYRELKGIRDNVKFFYPDTFEESILNFILSGNYQDAKELVNKVVDINMKRDVPSLLFKEAMTSVLNSIFKGVSQKDISINIVFENNEDIYEILMQCVDGIEIKDYLGNRIDTACKSILALNLGTNEYVIKKITDFVKENYSRDIYLELVAEQVEMSPKYISRLFKEQTGVCFVDYVNKIRLEKAVELLLNSDKKLLDIAENTGFNNLTTFMRTFKKYKGVSPGVYKASAG